LQLYAGKSTDFIREATRNAIASKLEGAFVDAFHYRPSPQEVSCRSRVDESLAMALTGEVGELVELFQWATDAESAAIAANPATARAVRDELADVLSTLYGLQAS